MKSKEQEEKHEQGQERKDKENDREAVVRIRDKKVSYKKSIASASIPFIVLTAMILFLFSPSLQSFINSGIPLPNVTIEKIEFGKKEGQIIVFIRNTGPTDITIAQA